MKASEVIERLQYLLKQHGDQNVLVDTGRDLEQIEELDIDVEETGFIVWMG
jgi:hypothetical protein